MSWLDLSVSSHGLISSVVDHIFEKLSPAMDTLGLECSCLGGGKIEHDSNGKKLRVFGESTVI